MAFNLDNYTEVKDRLPLFWDKYPNGRVHTELVEDVLIMEKDEIVGAKVTFKAALFADRSDESSMISTGYAQETEESSKVPKYFENCETSAIGRALANGGFGGTKTEKRPSREEMESSERAGKTNKKIFKRKY